MRRDALCSCWRLSGAHVCFLFGSLCKLIPLVQEVEHWVAVKVVAPSGDCQLVLTRFWQPHVTWCSLVPPYKPQIQTFTFVFRTSSELQTSWQWHQIGIQYIFTVSMQIVCFKIKVYYPSLHPRCSSQTYFSSSGGSFEEPACCFLFTWSEWCQTLQDGCLLIRTVSMRCHNSHRTK
jgi:hypothetical protein